LLNHVHVADRFEMFGKNFLSEKYSALEQTVINTMRLERAAQ